MLSPLSKGKLDDNFNNAVGPKLLCKIKMCSVFAGLFNRVMSFSGSPLSHWALHPKHNRLGLLIAKHVKCPAYDQEILVKCFRERSVEELLEAQKYILEVRSKS